MTRLRQGFTRFFHVLMVISLLGVCAGSNGWAAPKKVDINTATEAELAKVPGISKELAKLIVEYREAEGEIESWDEVRALQQEAELRKLEKHLKVGTGDN